MLRGTEGSNLPSSSGESRANLTSDAAQHFSARGFDVARPQLSAALTAARKVKCQVIVTKLDRLSGTSISSAA
jgi:DNA invertase Pin-like site-specific DNA recombinase